MKLLLITFCLCLSIIIYSCDGGGPYYSIPKIFIAIPSNLPIKVESFKDGYIKDSFNSINLYKQSVNDFIYDYKYLNNDTSIQNKYYALLNNFDKISKIYSYNGGYFSNYYDSIIIYYGSTKIKKYFRNPNNIKNDLFFEADCFNGYRLRCANNYFADTISLNIQDRQPRYLYIFSEIDYQTADTLIR